ncbi:MAG: hypothetical protein K940chlam5_01455 [Candidatus Anoxychlamydiales bacterium]|nr:hypothetical protein [Candidatus Anoxychlamydiales bacterium]
MGLDYFDKIFFINLDHREDRKDCLLNQLSKLGVKEDKIVRISATFDPLNGHRGCAMSHIKALNLATENNLNNVLILEDDCLFLQNRANLDKLLKYFFETVDHWDVFFLDLCTKGAQDTKYKKIKKVLKSIRTHAYAVNKHYIPTLKKCFTEAHSLLQNELFFSQTLSLAIDRYWHRLQRKDNWYMLDAAITKQSTSYSDIDYMEKIGQYYK